MTKGLVAVLCFVNCMLNMLVYAISLQAKILCMDLKKCVLSTVPVECDKLLLEWQSIPNTCY